jgi:hypothetical protein
MDGGGSSRGLPTLRSSNGTYPHRARPLVHVPAMGQSVRMPRLQISKLEWVLLEALAGFVLARAAVVGVSALLDDGRVDGWLLNLVGAVAGAAAAGFRWRKLSERADTKIGTSASSQ